MSDPPDYIPAEYREIWAAAGRLLEANASFVPHDEAIEKPPEIEGQRG